MQNSLRSAALAVVLSGLSIATFAESMVEGVVVVGERGCKKYDLVVIDTNDGYVLAEQYGGSFDKGDKVVGALNSYGFKDVLVNGRSGRLYIDDYMLSRDRAAEKCFRE